MSERKFNERDVLGRIQLSKTGKAVFVNLSCGLSGWLSSNKVKAVLEGSQKSAVVWKQKPRRESQ